MILQNGFVERIQLTTWGFTVIVKDNQKNIIFLIKFTKRRDTMPLPKEEIYTIDDIYALPEGESAELIDGHIYYMAPPSRTHQKISMELSSLI